ncbi:hypothetical protein YASMINEVIRUS_92 [Yasminevirus sp. GU-2018]|uniref:Uncharacterized protein n=1 Tax=Yasminevirus sp. GU-2018 TaxID=2420051 RepID=A0A5K0U6Q4_9VIRU|nr:hypothetical protein YASMINEVIRUS_92 [Yasminevirus sp. GU-2018]
MSGTRDITDSDPVPVNTEITNPLVFKIAEPNKCVYDDPCIRVSCCDLDENFMTLLYQVRLPFNNLGSETIDDEFFEKAIEVVMNATPTIRNDNVSVTLPASFTDLFSSAKSDAGQPYFADIMVRYRFVRVTKKHVKGKILYSTTLLPGERTRIFSSSAHTDFTYNASSKTYESNTSTSAEASFMSAVQNSMTKHAYNSSSSKKEQDSSSNSSWNAGGSAGLNLGIVSVGGGGGGGGASSDHSSSVDMTSQFTDSVESAASQSAIAVSASRTTNIRESSSSTNIQGENNSVVNAYSRELYNANKACPVTYYFRGINKCMEVRLELANIGFRIRVPGSINSFNPTPTTRPVLVNIKPANVSGTDVDIIKVVRNRLLLDAISGTGPRTADISTQNITQTAEVGAATATGSAGEMTFGQRLSSIFTGKVSTTVQQAPITNDNLNLTFTPIGSTAPETNQFSYIPNNTGLQDKYRKFTALMALTIAARLNCTSVDKRALENEGTRAEVVALIKKILLSPTIMGNTVIYDFIRDWPISTVDEKEDICDEDRDALMRCNMCRGLIVWAKEVRLPSDGIAMDSCVGSSVYEDYEIETKTKLLDVKMRTTKADIADKLSGMITALSTDATNIDKISELVGMYKTLTDQASS